MAAALGFQRAHPAFSPLLIPYSPFMGDYLGTRGASVPPKKSHPSKPRKATPVSHIVSQGLASAGDTGMRKQKTTLEPATIDPFTGKTKLPKLTIRKEAYPCPHCDRIFSSMSGRFYHMPVHTGQYTYRCPECHQGFMELSKFKRHLWKKHNREYVEG